MSGLDRVRALLDEGAATGVFPAAQACVFHEGAQVLFAHAGTATASTRFDLASLTKVMGTTAAFMRLWSEGTLTPNTPVADLLPGAHPSLTFEDLLRHRSGLPAFVPFFADALRENPALLDEGCPPELRHDVRRTVVVRACAIPLEAPPRERAVYSDVGFILLGEALARAAGITLDALAEHRVLQPLGLSARYHRLSHGFDPNNVAPTGRARPREPAPGQESLWAPFPPHPTRAGEVDDDNAFVLDGVAGHAGLFGTARDVAGFGAAVLGELAGAARIASAEQWETLLSREDVVHGSARTMGFDTPGPSSSAGRYLGDTAPGAFGHLGFTGTSLWIDRPRRLVVALLTNRTYNGRGNLQIRDFRPRFHDAVVEALGLQRLHG